MPKKRRITRTEALRRQKISRALKRYHRERKAQAQRRSLAAKRAAVTRKANRELRRIQQTKTVKAESAPPELAVESEEWEVTVKYTVGKKGKHRGETVDITLRLIGAAGLRFTNAQVRAAAWYAMKHGPGALKEFSLAAQDWYNTRRSGHVEGYHYAGDDEAALENARGIFHTVGLGGLRVALVE